MPLLYDMVGQETVISHYTAFQIESYPPIPSQLFLSLSPLRLAIHPSSTSLTSLICDPFSLNRAVISIGGGLAREEVEGGLRDRMC